MKASSTAKLTQDESTSGDAHSPSPSLSDQFALASADKLTFIQFRRLLADYRRAGYEYAQHVHLVACRQQTTTK